MKAAVLYEANEPLRLDDIEMPEVGNDDLLVKVAACGVCHTDLKVAEGRTPFKAPTILGHEVSGTVEEVGSNQRDAFAAGDRVIVGMRYKCGRCRYCLGARDNLCSNRPAPPSYKKPDGAPVHRWNVGGFAQYLAVPGYMVFHLPEDLTLDESSVIGCRVTTAYHAVKQRGRLEPGDSSLVIGCGGIGLNTIQFLKCFGAHPIIAVDVIDEKLEAAKRFGATHTINATKEDPVRAVRDLTDGGVDKAFEAIGNRKTADQAVSATRAGGTATIIGGLGSDPFTLSDGRFSMSEKTITGVSSRQASDVVEVLKMVQDRRIEVNSLITKKYGSEQLNDALKDLEDGGLLMGISLWND